MGQDRRRRCGPARYRAGPHPRGVPAAELRRPAAGLLGVRGGLGRSGVRPLRAAQCACPQDGGLRHCRRVAQGAGRNAGRLLLRADGTGRRPGRPIFRRRGAGELHTEPGPAACEAGRRAGALRRAAGRAAGHGQYRPDQRHHRLPGAGLLLLGQCPRHPGGSGHRRALCRSGARREYRRAEGEDFGLHQCLWPPSPGQYRHPGRR